MAKALVEPPALYVVLEPFVAEENGVMVAYRRGEVIHPDDPHVKSMPSRFGPFEFPHPVRRRGVALAAPEIRAD
jgi:hypothetical protein